MAFTDASIETKEPVLIWDGEAYTYIDGVLHHLNLVSTAQQEPADLLHEALDAPTLTKVMKAGVWSRRTNGSPERTAFNRRMSRALTEADDILHQRDPASITDGIREHLAGVFNEWLIENNIDPDAGDASDILRTYPNLTSTQLAYLRAFIKQWDAAERNS
jgi:hypothetical protein